ncbi:MAG: hypothetical protein WC707_02385 [Candidatus Babeliaceae bacterium]|jgi:hypothetical protein
MYLIECWFRNINNAYFVKHHPLFKPFAEKLSFDKFGELYADMLIALHKELSMQENVNYLKKLGIKSMNAVVKDVEKELAEYKKKKS